jgi:hypothetical protein
MQSHLDRLCEDGKGSSIPQLFCDGDLSLQQQQCFCTTFVKRLQLSLAGEAKLV